MLVKIGEENNGGYTFCKGKSAIGTDILVWPYLLSFLKVVTHNIVQLNLLKTHRSGNFHIMPFGNLKAEV